MLCEEDCPKRLAFVPGCRGLVFVPVNDDEMIATLEVEGAEAMLCVKAFDEEDGLGQVHVTLRLAQRVPGHAAIELASELAQDPDAFGVWVDPCDGETLITYALERDDAEELAALIDREMAAAHKYLPAIRRLEAKAVETGERRDNPFDPDRLVELGA